MSWKKWTLACGLGTGAIALNLAGQYLILRHFESRRAPLAASIQNAPDAPVWLGDSLAAPGKTLQSSTHRTQPAPVPRFTDTDGFPLEHAPLVLIDPPAEDIPNAKSDSAAPLFNRTPGNDRRAALDSDPEPILKQGGTLVPPARLKDDFPFHSVRPIPRDIDSPTDYSSRPSPFVLQRADDEEGAVIAPRPQEADLGPALRSSNGAATSNEKDSSAKDGAAAVIREIVRQELPQASDAERRVWENQLSGFPAAAARDLLQLRKQIDASGLDVEPRTDAKILEVDTPRGTAPKFPLPEPARPLAPITGRPIK